MLQLAWSSRFKSLLREVHAFREQLCWNLLLCLAIFFIGGSSSTALLKFDPTMILEIVCGIYGNEAGTYHGSFESARIFGGSSGEIEDGCPFRSEVLSSPTG